MFLQKRKRRGDGDEEYPRKRRKLNKDTFNQEETNEYKNIMTSMKREDEDNSQIPELTENDHMRILNSVLNENTTPEERRAKNVKRTNSDNSTTTPEVETNFISSSSTSSASSNTQIRNPAEIRFFDSQVTKMKKKVNIRKNKLKKVKKNQRKKMNKKQGSNNATGNIENEKSVNRAIEIRRRKRFSSRDKLHFGIFCDMVTLGDGKMFPGRISIINEAKKVVMNRIIQAPKNKKIVNYRSFETCLSSDDYERCESKITLPKLRSELLKFFRDMKKMIVLVGHNVVFTLKILEIRSKDNDLEVIDVKYYEHSKMLNSRTKRPMERDLRSILKTISDPRGGVNRMLVTKEKAEACLDVYMSLKKKFDRFHKMNNILKHRKLKKKYSKM